MCHVEPIALALRRAGHSVYGIARTPVKAKEPLLQDIYPVQGTVEEPSTWVPLVVSSMDIVIDSSSSANGVSDSIIDAVLTTERIKQRGTRLGLMYVSGTWVHGTWVHGSSSDW